MVEQPDPYQVAYEAILKQPNTTGLKKVTRAGLFARAVTSALRHAGLLSHEGQMAVMTRGHYGDQRSTCPTCGVELRRIGLVDVAYTYEPCSCPLADFVHLVEQLWHRDHVGGHRKIGDRSG